MARLESEGPLLADGALGTMLHAHGVAFDRCFDELNLTPPAAVAEIHGLHMSGLPAWLIWVFVHIMYLIGFKNRIVVMIQWAWAYIGYRRGIRLITGEPEMHLLQPRNMV